MGAAMSNQSDALALLLEKGAALDLVDHEGLTAFGWAASNGALDCIRALEIAGADTLAHVLSPSTS